MNPANAHDEKASERPRKSRLRRWVGNFVVLAVTTVLCLLLLELCVRWFLPFFSPGRQIPFVLRGEGVATGPPLQTMRASTPKGDYDLPIHFNSHGFRDQKDLRAATTNDWFALGDSFTFGWGVTEEERFSSVLERLWSTNAGPKVYNIAIPDNFVGYQRLLAFAEKSGARVGHLVVGVCMENDLLDYREGRSAWDGASAAVLQRTPVKEKIRYVLKRSALYNCASFSLQRNAWGRKLAERIGIARSIDELTQRNTYSDVVLSSSRDQLLKVIAGRDAVVLIIPSRRLWHGDNVETERRVHDGFVQKLREAGVEFVDMRPVMDQSSNALSFYFATDAHWNAQGHHLAAVELSKALARRNGATNR